MVSLPTSPPRQRLRRSDFFKEDVLKELGRGVMVLRRAEPALAIRVQLRRMCGPKGARGTRATAGVGDLTPWAYWGQEREYQTGRVQV